MRLWINEESTPQPEVRAYFDQELKEALQEQGIDIRERALTIEAARAAIHAKEAANREQQVFEERLEIALGDDKLREGYFQKAKEHIDQLEYGSPAEFYKLVNANIQKIFEDAYLEKLNTIYQKSVEAHTLEKRRMFIRFKKFLFQSRILTYAHEECDRLFNQVKAFPYKLPHFNVKWDSETYLATSHPEVGKSFLTLLASAVGKRSLVVPELAKAYITDKSGKVAKNLTLFTFDKEELLKLRRDILQNPAKYESMLLL